MGSRELTRVSSDEIPCNYRWVAFVYMLVSRMAGRALLVRRGVVFFGDLRNCTLGLGKAIWGRGCGCMAHW